MYLFGPESQTLWSSLTRKWERENTPRIPDRGGKGWGFGMKFPGACYLARKCYHQCDGKWVTTHLFCIWCAWGREPWFVALANFLVQRLPPRPKLSYVILSLMQSWKECIATGCQELVHAASSMPLSVAQVNLQSFQHFRELVSAQSYRELWTGTSPELVWRGGDNILLPRPSPQQWKGYPTVLCGWNPWGPLGGSKALAGEEAARSRKSRAEQSWWVQVERSEASFQERRKDPRIHPNQFTPSLPSPLSIPTSSCFFLASITF